MLISYINKLTKLYYRANIALCIPNAIVGAGLGVSYHAFFNVFWKEPIRGDTFSHTVYGGAIYGAFVAVMLFHPRSIWGGMVAGAFLNVLKDELVHSNRTSTRETVGSVIPLPGLTSEQRDRQASKDYIHFLSLQPSFKFDTLKDF